MPDLDTSTPEGFREGRERLGLSTERLSRLIDVNERTIKRWEGGERPPHPTAAVMLDWMLDGYRPPDWHMDGLGFKSAREALGMSRDQLGLVIDADPDIISLWESDDRGPPGMVARAIRWLLNSSRD